MKIEILVGMIASGKSTYARDQANDGALIVSHDDLTEMLHGQYVYFSGLRDVYREMEEQLVRVAITKGYDVVIDRTHLTRESRKRWVDIAERVRESSVGSREPIEIVAVVFPVQSPTEHAMRRHQDDSRGRDYAEWLKVAAHHFDQSQLEPLADDEGFDRIIRISPITEV